MWRLDGRFVNPRVAAALGLGLSLLAVSLVVVFSGSPLVLAGANPVPADRRIATAKSGAGACQGGEIVPTGVTAIRLILVAIVGPRVDLSVESPSGSVVSGSTGSGWTAGAVTVPVKPLPHPITAARVCFRLGRSVEAVAVGGSAAAPPLAARARSGETLPGRFTVEYLRPGRGSWWSSAETVSRRLGLGHAPSGTWLALPLLLAMGSVLTASCWIALRELR
jgi:hypothetical protein